MSCNAKSGAGFRHEQSQNISVLVVGPTGYIGRFVVKELIRRGYKVTVFARERSGVKGKNSKEQTIKVCLKALPSDYLRSQAVNSQLERLCKTSS